MDKSKLLKLIRIKAWLVLMGIFAMIAYAVYENRQNPENSTVQMGTVQIGGPFKLTTHEGKILLDTQLSGTPFLVFFGFTHCPDICPNTLFETTQLLNALGENGKKLKVLFITVDPIRDTPEVLKNYLQNFHPNIIGLTGTQAEIDAVVKNYRAYAKKAPPSANGDYSMDHSTAMYMMGRFGTFITAIRPDEPLEKRVNTIQKYFNN